MLGEAAKQSEKASQNGNNIRLMKRKISFLNIKEKGHLILIKQKVSWDLDYIPKLCQNKNTTRRKKEKSYVYSSLGDADILTKI